MTIDNKEPVYPSTSPVLYRGISIRLHIAIECMKAMMASPKYTATDAAFIAKDCFAVARLMLKEEANQP